MRECRQFAARANRPPNKGLCLRASVGASRSHLVRSLLVEAAVLASIAVAAGVATTAAVGQLLDGVRLFASIGPLTGIHLDWRVIVFAGVCGALTVVAFGLAPILSATRLDLRRSCSAPLDSADIPSPAPGTGRHPNRAVDGAGRNGSLADPVPFESSGDQPWHGRRRRAELHIAPRSTERTGAAGEALVARAVERLRTTPGIDVVATANPSPF